jgi:hypothetical protein
MTKGTGRFTLGDTPPQMPEIVEGQIYFLQVEGQKPVRRVAVKHEGDYDYFTLEEIKSPAVDELKAKLGID